MDYVINCLIFVCANVAILSVLTGLVQRQRRILKEEKEQKWAPTKLHNLVA